MKYIIYFLLIFIFLFLKSATIYAISDPLAVPNNRFGIHIVDPNDLADAASLVNSNGGKWGYVTLVIAQNDRNKDKWQHVFDKMRQLHLIPIVRLATSPNGGIWSKPDQGDLNNWADFLDSLNWVVKNRYVIIFNEPNHAAEWGGSLDPAGYDQILSDLSDKLKKKSPDFFILPAGLDASAPNGSDTMDEVEFIRGMIASQPNIFAHIDGWVSHSYPNPGFIGSPYANGRGTVRTYQWEKNLLSSQGVWRNFPIFITETGWPHLEGVNIRPNFISQNQASLYITASFENIWTDSDLVAITPFLLNYQTYPFDNFSWKKPDNSSFYDMYYATQNLPKLSGQPEQITRLTILNNPFPRELITDSDYTLEAEVKNEGQSIFDINDGFYTQILLNGPPQILTNMRSNIELQEYIEPGRTGKIKINLHTSSLPGNLSLTMRLVKGNTVFTIVQASVTLRKPPSLSFAVQAGLKEKTTDTDFTLIIYDPNEMPVQILRNVKVVGGKGQIASLRNVIVGKNYRVVIEKPYYLPRQEKLVFKEDNNFLKFKPLLPLDLDLDGKFTFTDYLIIISHPIFTFRLLF